jgi:hypothetical protein
MVILKVRFNEEAAKAADSGSSSKPKGKAAKKRAMVSKLADAEAVYDNQEEELLFQVCYC